MEFIGAIRKSGVSLEEPKEIEAKYEKYRTAVRFVIFDEDNKLALNYRPEQFGYKEQYSIPGGGVELGESLEEALKREALEEIGSEIKDIKEIGYVLEYTESPSRVQKTYFYSGNVGGEKKKLLLTKEEIKTNLSVVWLPFDEAYRSTQKMTECFAKTRSLLVLDWIKNKK